MKRQFLKKKIIILALCGTLLGFAGAATPAYADTNPFTGTGPAYSQCTLDNHPFFGFQPWYHYLKGESVTDKSTNVTACRPHLDSINDIWLIAAALFEILLQLAALAAVGYVIYGGFIYIISRGSPERINGARDTIVNAITGLVVALVSARIIGYIAGLFSGATSNKASLFLPNVGADKAAIGTVLSVVFQIAAALAVFFIVWGGFTYARSNGDPGTIKQSKDTIIYALIGLAVAIFANAIIIFVFNRLI